MSDVIEFRVPLPHVGLRRNSETRAIGYRSALKRAWQEEIWCAGYENQAHRYSDEGEPWPRASVHYVWHSTHETDVDNIIAACKPLLDVLKATGPRPLGIIADDGPGISVTAEWQKARTRAYQCVVVRIERVQNERAQGGTT